MESEFRKISAMNIIIAHGLGIITCAQAITMMNNLFENKMI